MHDVRTADPRPAHSATAARRPFEGVESVELQLARDVSRERPGAIAELDGNWTDGRGIDRARVLARAFISDWDLQHFEAARDTLVETSARIVSQTLGEPTD